jgi:hypothetical protein
VAAVGRVRINAQFLVLLFTRRLKSLDCNVRVGAVIVLLDVGGGLKGQYIGAAGT